MDVRRSSRLSERTDGDSSPEMAPKRARGRGGRSPRGGRSSSASQAASAFDMDDMALPEGDPAAAWASASDWAAGGASEAPTSRPASPARAPTSRPASPARADELPPFRGERKALPVLKKEIIAWFTDLHKQTLVRLKKVSGAKRSRPSFRHTTKSSMAEIMEGRLAILERKMKLRMDILHREIETELNNVRAEGRLQEEVVDAEAYALDDEMNDDIEEQQQEELRRLERIEVIKKLQETLDRNDGKQDLPVSPVSPVYQTELMSPISPVYSLAPLSPEVWPNEVPVPIVHKVTRGTKHPQMVAPFVIPMQMGKQAKAKGKAKGKPKAQPKARPKAKAHVVAMPVVAPVPVLMNAPDALPAQPPPPSLGSMYVDPAPPSPLDQPSSPTHNIEFIGQPVGKGTKVPSGLWPWPESVMTRSRSRKGMKGVKMTR